MNSQHRAIRALLTTMAPKRAIGYITSFELPEEEEFCLIECDVRRRSHVQVADMLHISPECVKKRRQRAYAKIADQLNYP